MRARWMVAVLAAVWGLGGNADAWSYGATHAAEVPAVAPLPGSVAVTFDSAVRDPYYVLSGPVETYRAFRFNEMFQKELAAYVAEKGGPGAGTFTLTVHLETLTTAYGQLGAGLSPRGTDLALAGSPRLARGPFLNASHFREGDGDWSFPAEITKSATLRFSVSLRSDDRTVGPEELSARAETTVTWDDWDPWGPHWALRAYDYGPVLRAAIGDAVARIDGFVNGAVNAPAR